MGISKMERENGKRWRTVDRKNIHVTNILWKNVKSRSVRPTRLAVMLQLCMIFEGPFSTYLASSVFFIGQMDQGVSIYINSFKPQPSCALSSGVISASIPWPPFLSEWRSLEISWNRLDMGCNPHLGSMIAHSKGMAFFYWNSVELLPPPEIISYVLILRMASSLGSSLVVQETLTPLWSFVAKHPSPRPQNLRCLNGLSSKLKDFYAENPFTAKYLRTHTLPPAHCKAGAYRHRSGPLPQ